MTQFPEKNYFLLSNFLYRARIFTTRTSPGEGAVDEGCKLALVAVRQKRKLGGENVLVHNFFSVGSVKGKCA